MHTGAQSSARHSPSPPTHRMTGAIGWQQCFLRPTCVFRMRDPTGLLWPQRVPQVLGLGPLQTLPYNRRMAEGSGSSSVCSGTAVPGCDPPVPQTRCPGAPEKKPQTFGVTEVHGPGSPQSIARLWLSPPMGNSPTSGQQHSDAEHSSAPATAGELQGHGGFRDGTNCVPAERGAFLKANTLAREEGAELHPVPSPSAPRQEDARR